MHGQIRLCPFALLAQPTNSLAQADTDIGCHKAILSVFFRLHFAYRIHTGLMPARFQGRRRACRALGERATVPCRLSVTASLVLAWGLCVGCQKQLPKSKSVIGAALTGTPSVQRFVIVSNTSVPVGFLALDTQTGSFVGRGIGRSQMGPFLREPA